KPEPIVKRFNMMNDEDLRGQLARTREVTLEPPGKNTGRVVVAGKQTAAGQINEVADFLKSKGLSDHFTPKLLNQRADLNGLPYRMGADCQLDTDSAKKMQAFSLTMRRILSEAMPQGEGAIKDPKADVVRAKINSLYNPGTFNNRIDLGKEEL